MMTPALNATLNDCRHIWRVTERRQDASDSLMRWLALLLAGTSLAIAAVEFARDSLSPLLLARLVLGAAGIWIGVVYLVRFVPGSIGMNSAANARLMPRQRRRLVQMATAGWLLATVSITFAVGNWIALPLVGLFLLSVMLAEAGRQGMLVFAAIAGNWQWLSRGVLPQALVDAAESGVGVLALTLALLLMAAWSLGWMYPAGGDAHRARDLRQASHARRGGPENPWTRIQDERMALWSGRGVYAAALRRDCRIARPGKAAADALLLHALGPAAHWSIWIGSAVFMLALGMAARLALSWTAGGSGQYLALGISVMGTSVLVAAVVFSTAQYGKVLRGTRGEQQLLRLTPLTGDTVLMNRRLARQLLRRFLAGWAMLTAAILATTALVGIGAAEDVLLRQFALCCLGGQVASTGLLGDHARGGVWSLQLAIAAAVLAALQGAAAVALGALAASLPWPWLIALSLGGAALVLRRGWRRMLAAPPAFPSGRFDR